MATYIQKEAGAGYAPAPRLENGAGDEPDAAQQYSKPLIRVDGGFLRGAIIPQRNEQIAVQVFKGIPYASPPVGPLRWRSPQPLKPWTGIREALAFGPDCPQQQPANGTRAPGMSEDCLYLNIWAPARQSKGRLPVMVWIHGGSFISGSGADLSCDGAALAREGVVLVTINYRLGLFGFLAHPGLSAESGGGVSGNYGLLDQISALRWIQANIAEFGGDPDRVTVFGVSAGSASIALLLTSPLASGLFQQAILQSPGSGRPLATLSDAESAGAILGANITALRNMPAESLLAQLPRVVPGMRSLTAARMLRPIIDNWVITRDERDAFESGRFHAVPTIVGGNADEGSVLTAHWPPMTQAEFEALLATNFPECHREALALYPVEQDADVRRRVAEVFSDSQFNYGVRMIARSLVKRQAPTWRYLFCRRQPEAADGPHHGDEVAYVFGNLDFGREDDGPGLREADRVLSSIMRRAWAAFATTGSPNAPGLPSWPEYDPERDETLVFDTPLGVGRRWREAQLDFLDAYHRSR